MKLYYLAVFLGSALPLAQAQPLTPDPRLILSLYFAGGSYSIDPGQDAALVKFIKSFPAIENYTITVHSHTDNIGSAGYNQWLAENRSHAVIKRLLSLKIPREIISIHDFGEVNPVYDNATYEGRLRNRRVDVILWPRETL